MNEIISINYNDEQPTVLGRDLHEALEVATPYDKWFPRMCEYGFEADKDYSTFLSDRSDGRAGKPRTEHQLTIPMAKEICMLQRSDKGRELRKYFIAIEEQWNTPEAVMLRALERLKSAALSVTQLQAIPQQKQDTDYPRSEIEHLKRLHSALEMKTSFLTSRVKCLSRENERLSRGFSFVIACTMILIVALIGCYVLVCNGLA